MGVLFDQRQERFCQEVAKGATVAQAYRNAGYAPSKGNAYKLRLRKGVAARIDELMAFRTASAEREVLSAAEQVGVNAVWVLRRLRQNAVLSARRGDTAASNRATELIGKHIGMFIDKKEIQINMIDDADEYLARILAIVDAKVIEGEATKLVDGVPSVVVAIEDGNKYGPADTEQPDPIDIIEESS